MLFPQVTEDGVAIYQDEEVYGGRDLILMKSYVWAVC